MAELETQVQLLKKELHDQSKIHDRIDVAIEKLTDVSNSINRMLAVHEEKLGRQEEAIFEAEQKLEIRRTELGSKIEELHSRITTNTKEIMTAASAQHTQQNNKIPHRVKPKRVEIIQRLWLAKYVHCYPSCTALLRCWCSKSLYMLLNIQSRLYFFVTCSLWHSFWVTH
jgi:hypothetical protein